MHPHLMHVNDGDNDDRACVQILADLKNAGVQAWIYWQVRHRYTSSSPCILLLHLVFFCNCFPAI